MDLNQIKDIKIEEFDYPLPDERIAKHPLADRDQCRLLEYSDGRISHHVFSELPDLLPYNTLLVMNNTRVINARMEFHRATGARIEVFLLEPIDPRDYAQVFQTRGRCRWQCMVGNLKKWKDDILEKQIEIRPEGRPVERIFRENASSPEGRIFNENASSPEGRIFNENASSERKLTLKARRIAPMEGNSHEIEFTWDDPDVTFASVVEAAGNIPIPPYLNRDSEESDATDYQTVYSRIEGSVAAPTAGLHFTPQLLARLEAKDVEMKEVTLHVGAGTFQPVKSEEIGEHPMHTEVFEIDRCLLYSLRRAVEYGDKVIAVGTTTVRTLESLPILGMQLMRGDKSLKVNQWEAYSPESLAIDTVDALRAIERYMDRRHLGHLTASTAIMIAPGFNWRIVRGMVTNFHQPQSTLLLLVSSFLDGADLTAPAWKKIYAAALQNDYRFLSYGDACLFLK